MKPIHWATLALLWGTLGSSPLFAQNPDFGPPPSSSSYDDRRSDAWDDRDYDDRDYDRSPRGDVGFFYDELSPYGEWVRTREHGWAWFPRNVHAGWRPYDDGRWVNTDYGWTWASYEPFGWATYHYGRWAWDPRFGWLWVPGTVWGPAWVSWQYGDGYVGWAPLPPAVDFEIGFGLRLGGLDLSIGIRPDFYNFVPEHSFLDSRVSRHRVPTARNVTIIHNTTNITQYNYVDNRVINRGVEVRNIERATGRRSPRLHVAAGRTKARSEISAGQLRLYRPEKRQLDAVLASPRTTAPGHDRDQRTPEALRAAPEVQVAPRTRRAPQLDARESEKLERQDREALGRHQAEEQRLLAKLQGDEMAKVSELKQRDELQKRNQVERRAQREEQKKAGARLQARQEAERRAELKPPAEAKPPEVAKPKASGREPQRERRPQSDKPKPKPPV
jgi:hypothetical protein